MLLAPNTTGTTLCHGNGHRYKKQFHFAVTLYTIGLHMKVVQLQLLESGLDVLTLHEGLCGGETFYPMTDDERF